MTARDQITGLRSVSRRRYALLWVMATAMLSGKGPAFAEDGEPPAPAKAKQPIPATKPIQAPAAAGDKTPKNKDGQPKPVNPLDKFIRKLFPKKKPAAKPIAKPKPARVKRQAAPKRPLKKPAAPRATRASRDQIDALAPQDHRVLKSYRAAVRKFEAGQWDQAVELLQLLLDPRRGTDGTRTLVDSLIRRDDGTWISARREANNLLGRLPADVLERYRRQYGPAAQAMLHEAQEQGDLYAYVEVATRYFHTDAGLFAANYLGTYHFDRGEFGLAARWFEQLLETRAVGTTDPKWRLKAAFAFRQIGREEQARQLLEEMSAGKTPGKIELGGLTIDPEAWLKKFSEFAKSADLKLDDWRFLYGSPGRTGTAVGGEPILLRRWSVPTINSGPTTELISELVDDLHDSSRATIPAVFPIMAQGRVVFRTLRGVKVVDASTGDELWETRTHVSAEELLGGTSDGSQRNSTARFNARPFGRGLRRVSYRVNPDRHPLTNLLFRNGTWGVISSHGEQLFVLEDHAVLATRLPGNGWSGDMGQSDPHRRSWSTNRIASYDLNTGRPLWSIGGEEMHEPFDLPLAGTYFFGTPVADDGELFVVGEKDNEIRLFAVDADSGTPLWSQLIAYSDAKIEKDLGRRWWNAQISLSDGVLVCPTTVGWLVAVDRVRRSVLWATRYSDSSKSRRTPRRQNSSMVQQRDLNQVWSPSAPMISGNRVIYAPSEQASMVCVDLFDGSMKWSVKKSASLYVAGVFDGRVVVVGKSNVVAYSLDDGKSLWPPLRLRPGDGVPSGVGVAADGHYYLPLSSGGLWKIDLSNGRRTARTRVRRTSRPLGNLVMYNGMLFSLNPFEMSGYEQRAAITEEIRNRRNENPVDAWALLQEADIHSLNREFSEALALLRRVESDSLDDAFRERYRLRMVEALTSAIRYGSGPHEDDLDELSRVVATPDETIRLRRLQAEDHLDKREYIAVFDIYRAMSEQFGDVLIDRDEPEHISLGLHTWLAGKLSDVWTAATADARTKLDEQIGSAAHKALASGLPAQRRFARLFGFHRSVVPVQLAIVKANADQGEFVRAEHILLDLSKHADDQIGADAVLRLARLMERFKLPYDADHFYDLLTSRYPQTRLEGGMTTTQFVSQRDKAVLASDDKTFVIPSWEDYEFRLERSGTNYNSQMVRELSPGMNRLPFYQRHRIHVSLNHSRTSAVKTLLSVASATDDSVHWMVPLRMGTQSQQAGYVAVHTHAHRMMLQIQDTIHCISPAERRVLWSRPISGQMRAVRGLSNRRTIQPMGIGRQSHQRRSLLRQPYRNAAQITAGSKYICAFGRRELQVLDAMTGDVRWTLNSVAKSTRLIGTDDTLYLIPEDRSKTIALRASDGKRIDTRADLIDLLGGVVHVIGNTFVELRPPTAKSSKPKDLVTKLRRVDPISGKVYWEVNLPPRAQFSFLDDGHLIALEKSGQLQMLDLESGTQRAFADRVGVGDVRKQSQHYALGDHETIFVIGNGRRPFGRNSAGNLLSAPVNGTITAFDRKTGKQLWKEFLKGHNLVLQEMRHSPVLLFLTRRSQNSGKLSYQTLSLLAFDKRTGRKLLDSTGPSNAVFNQLGVSTAERYLELSSFNQRLRLRAVKSVVLGTPITARKPAI